MPNRDPRAWPIRLIVALLLLLCGRAAWSHPMSIVVETAYVKPEAIFIEAVVFADDLVFYHRLKPNEAGEIAAGQLRAAAKDHRQLLLDRLPVYDEEGERLSGGEVVSVKGGDFKKDIPVGMLMAHTLTYELKIPLERPPEFLSFSQRLVDVQTGYPALVDLRVKQAGVDAEVTATLKPGYVQTVHLQWDDLEGATDTAERRTWMKASQEDALAARALNSVRSFLYITPHEVRHEILMPFPLLESYLTIARAHPAEITVAEQQAAREAILAFFRDKNPITIDGKPREPAASQVEFFALTNFNRAQKPPRTTISTINSRVGVMLTYPLESPAQSVELLWNAFNRRAWRVDAWCFVGDESQRTLFSKATREQRFTWEREQEPQAIAPEVLAAPQPDLIAIPWLSILFLIVGAGLAWKFWGQVDLVGGCAAGGIVLAMAVWSDPRIYVSWSANSQEPITSEHAEQIVTTLHHNLYLACAAPTDDQALEAICAATSGELRRKMYLQLVKAIEEPGVNDLRPASGEVKLTSGHLVDPQCLDGGFDYVCRWKATGRVQHWGHVHSRRYGYEATLHVAPRHGRWLIAGLHLERVQLLDDETVAVF